MLCYPVILTPDDNNTVMVTFPDIPEAVTFGENEKDALLRAVDALESMLAAKMDDNEYIPISYSSDNGPCVRLPAMTSAKVLLYQTMRQQNVTKAELAQRLGWRISQADRLLDLDHASVIDEIEQALNVLGMSLFIDVRAA